MFPFLKSLEPVMYVAGFLLLRVPKNYHFVVLLMLNRPVIFTMLKGMVATTLRNAYFPQHKQPVFKVDEGIYEKHLSA